ncbi:beta-N-acetylhexosaminidase [Shimia isoporae]|uniref:beta-N-acetylhexosaminidase n=1 Tax=Shimia isoporae TaxID=647720 RepID=A0A4R1NX18_9RHOB|nr:beta-N-acetylhexosaminidase [Shimia isoporae]TCL09702.1 beta-N-acetylhexosaminidase [Shimia isoporae]
MSPFGATIFGCEGLRLSAGERAFFRNARPFGFILFARNIETADQVRALCAELRSCVDHHAPILIDQEGGRVQRFRAPLATEFVPPLEEVERAGANASRAMYLRGRIIAHELHGMGVDANCAPMLDVARDGTHPFLKNRCYGTDPEEISSIGRAMADGLSDGGVLPVMKHMPGHGRAVVDSHFDLPTVTAAEAELAADFAPFKALNDLPMGMTAHLVYTAFDNRPATTSPKMMQLIREHIGFDGLVMTDDISMKALTAPLAEKSAASIAAGCDVVLHCNGDLAEMREVAQACGLMTVAAQARAEAALAARKTPDTVDIEALTAELKTF